jgi:pimeloyl-ACP methyl ester carboxylesterase
MKKLIIYTILVVSIFSLIGLTYQSYSSYIDEQNFPPTGNLVDIGGYKLHIKKLGKGDTTVVFDAGMGDSLLAWNHVIPDISKVAKVFAYDRAGLGWSEKSPLPRTSLHVVEELHVLLEKSNIKGPLILVGHSFGGLNMQLFAKKYPDNVVGLVLVDSAHENQLNKIPPTSLLRKTIFKAGIWAAPIGIPRLYLSLKNPAEQAVKSTTKHQYTSLDEAAMFARSMAIVKASQSNFNNLPLIVIAKNFPSALLKQTKSATLRNIAWANLQEELAQKSSNSTLIFSENKQHSIHRSQPKIVIDAIKQMINSLADTAS